jgi:guanylate kinase
MSAPSGKLILVVGPTGSGKGTLISSISALHPEIQSPVSLTTRTPRPGEENGKDYYFVTKEEFKQKISEGLFLEWAEYAGHYYGTPKSEIDSVSQKDDVVLLDIEVQGARQIKEIIPAEQLHIIFIEAGSWEDLKHRILARAPMTEEELENRKKRYDDEMTFEKEADYIVKNYDGKLEQAKKDFASTIDAILVS